MHSTQSILSNAFSEPDTKLASGDVKMKPEILPFERLLDQIVCYDVWHGVISGMKARNLQKKDAYGGRPIF